MAYPWREPRSSASGFWQNLVSLSGVTSDIKRFECSIGSRLSTYVSNRAADIVATHLRQMFTHPPHFISRFGVRKFRVEHNDEVTEF